MSINFTLPSSSARQGSSKRHCANCNSSLQLELVRILSGVTSMSAAGDSTTSCCCCCWSRSSRSRNFRHQHVASTRLVCASFWVLIIIAQITLLYSINYSAHPSGHYILWPHPRKLLLLRDAAANSAAAHSSHGSATPGHPGRHNDDHDSDTIYDADKRKVHTGPNPLHN